MPFARLGPPSAANQARASGHVTTNSALWRPFYQVGPLATVLQSRPPCCPPGLTLRPPCSLLGPSATSVPARPFVPGGPGSGLQRPHFCLDPPATVQLARHSSRRSPIAALQPRFYRFGLPARPSGCGSLGLVLRQRFYCLGPPAALLRTRPSGCRSPCSELRLLFPLSALPPRFAWLGHPAAILVARPSVHGSTGSDLRMPFSRLGPPVAVLEVRPTGHGSTG